MESPTPATRAEAALELTAEERDLLIVDVPAFSRTLKDPAARERYAALANAAGRGVVPPELLVSLAAMLELMLQTRAVRQRHGPDAEKLLTDLFFKTGRGAGLREAAKDVTRALKALEGQTLGKVRVTAAPGRHTIAIETDRAHLTLVVDNGGARVERVEVGG
ncbi:MAG: hypothetical protein M3O34_07755 [Chloroflexota bacterium]|nr:hypothetical protein [Chloroflexota bacterium]